MIVTEDLTKWFDSFPAVEGVNLKVDSGQVLALLGPNGAGKTTTIRMLTSILMPTRGKAVVAGYDVSLHPEKVRRNVGVLTEHHGLYGRMNALEYLDFYADLYGVERVKREMVIRRLLEKFGLAGEQKRRLSEYSKGMRQKLALVRALLHEPTTLLLDEPTSAMDPESARTVRDSIRGLRSDDRTILLCTHNLAEAEELADQVAIIRRGRVILNESLSAIKHQLMGAPEYEAVIAGSLNGFADVNLPNGVSQVGAFQNCLRFKIEEPEINNSQLLRVLLESGLAVMSFNEVHHSLEDAYLEAISREDGNHGTPN